MIEHPAELELLLKDEALMPTAVEEILRWSSPVTHFARVAMKDTELGGKQIHRGDRVVLWFPSANRDEEVLRDSLYLRHSADSERASSFQQRANTIARARIWRGSNCA